MKIAVRGEGWIHVGQPALQAAGLDPLVDPLNLRLYADGVEQAIAVTGNGDHGFTSDEAIEFWGVGRDTLSTDVRTYWLVSSPGGARVTTSPAAAGGAAPASFTRTERLVERSVYLSSILNGETSNFVGAVVSATPTMRTLTTQHLRAANAAEAVLRVTLQGVTATAHTVDVSLNGTLLGTCTLDKQARGTFTFPAPNVVEGSNQVALTARAASDYSATVSLELDYPHTYAADNDALVFTAPAETRLTVTGFSSAGVRVVDVTDPTRPVEVAVTVTPQGGANDARIDVPAGIGEHRLYAFTPARLGAAAAVTADAPSTWSATRDGELLVISHASFLDAVAPLVARRTQEGWSVQLVDVQDVYDEQGFGDKSPAAIRAFVQRARASWHVPPRFVLLVGDATFDPRNSLGKGDFDLVPTKLVDTATMETAYDDWFVDADLDGVPELAIGRLPVRTKAQADLVVQKTLTYAGKADLGRGGLFVTDTDATDLDFSTASAAGEAKVSDIMPVDRFQRDTSGAATVLLGKLGAGPFLVNYLGHGSVEVWDGLLSSTQAAALTNAHTSIYVVMNCLNGFFHDLYTTSLAESLLTAPQGGAVAVWASSTLAEYAPQPALNQEFLMRVSRTSLGETAVAAKAAITDLEARRTWLLFGDPTLFGTPTALPAQDAGADAGAMDAAPEAAPEAGTPDAGVTEAPAADAGLEAAPESQPDGEERDAGAADAGEPDATTAADAGASPDAMASLDAGTMPDTGKPADAKSDRSAPAPSGGGCSCNTGGEGATPAGLGLVVLGLCAGARRRRAPTPRRSARRPGPRALGLLALALAVLGWASGAEAAYSYRMAITIDRSRIGVAGGSTTLTNYPLLLDITSANLKTTANMGFVQHAMGYDISFQGADSTTCGGPSTCTFNYEIESYTASSGRVIAWVNIPALKTVANTTDTVIYVKYGDSSISSPTQNQNGTWNSAFKGVWHLNQASSPQSDSTSTPANATHTGSPSPASTSSGKIGLGVSTSGTTGAGYLDYRSSKFNWSSSDTFTYQGWFNTTDSTGPLFSQRNSGGNPVIDINVGYNGSTTNTNKMSVLVRDDTGVSFAQVNGTANVNDATWHHFAVTRTGGTIEVYVDGTSIGNNTNAGAAGAITTQSATPANDYQHIGREGAWVGANYGSTDDRFLAATFDEFRISNTLRAAEWIKTDYNTQGTPASTFSLGSQTLASCGDGSVIMGEACDDGNIVSGDGCSSGCVIETGYQCFGTAPSICSATCGDGMVAGSEACDDGGTTSGNGCSATCTLEVGYHCSGAPSVCTMALFDYYKVITIDRTKVGASGAATTLTNYPILISITDPALAHTGAAMPGHVRNTNGYDIVFRGLDTVTCGGATDCTLAHQVEKYTSSTGELVAWVNVPALKTQTNTANTQFRVLYGNQAISTSTERITSTWNSGFTGVWHLNQTPSGAGAMTDATSNANNGTPTGVTALSGGIMGAGVTMDGSTSYIAMNSGTSLNTVTSGAFTYSVWVNTADTLGGIFSLRSSTTGNPVMDIMVGMDGATTNAGKLMAIFRDDSGSGQADTVSASTTWNMSAWHLVTLTHSGTSMQLYLDNATTGTTPTTISAGSLTTDIRNLGREGRWVQDNYTTPGTNIYFAGSMDEARASNVARDIHWITTDYNNQSSPSTFITGYTTGLGTGNGEVTTNSTTSVDLISLDATESCAGTAIAWEMAHELDTLGFNIFREENGQRVKLNGDFIPGAGLSGGAGQRYAFVDTGPFRPGRIYWIENVTFSLDSRWYGPAVPLRSPGCVSAALPVLPGPGGAPTATPAGAGLAPATPGAPAFDQAGGCAVAPHGGNGLAAGPLALALAALALRRRRRS